MSARDPLYPIPLADNDAFHRLSDRLEARLDIEAHTLRKYAARRTLAMFVWPVIRDERRRRPAKVGLLSILGFDLPPDAQAPA